MSHHLLQLSHRCRSFLSQLSGCSVVVVTQVSVHFVPILPVADANSSSFVVFLLHFILVRRDVLLSFPNLYRLKCSLGTVHPC